MPPRGRRGPGAYHNPSYAYVPHPDQHRPRAAPAHHRVVIVGAGPVGLVMALELARHGVSSVLLDDNDTVSVGSRAICFAKRSLEICDRYASPVAGTVGQRMVDKGVTWSQGRVFLGEGELYRFDLLPEEGHKRPAFINLQQYYVEEYLVDAIDRTPLVSLRWRNRVVAIDAQDDGVTVAIETPDGPYCLTADWLIACDGARSPLRDMLGLAFRGEVFQDRFLIADVVMAAEYPTERWFWFDPPFHEGQSALLHRQPDNVWRIDLQLGWGADPQAEQQPEVVTARLKKMLGPERPFTIDWTSVYTFQCRRLERFVHGRVIFAGDSAHQVSPFGARGANSGVQDADNLGWKLAAVLDGRAPPALIDSYDLERIQAADENIRHSTRATDFIAPQGPQARRLRDAVLTLAAEAPFARAMVNSGRLSVPTILDGSPLNGDDGLPAAPARTRPGAPAVDARVSPGDGTNRPAWLIDQLGRGFTLLVADAATTAAAGLGPEVGVVAPADPHGDLAARYGLGGDGWVLFRPDGHVVTRGRGPAAARVDAAIDRALARA